MHNVRPDDAPSLHGIRVVDFTQFQAGTSCTQMLAWLGAEVIKVEEPAKGDPGRGVNDSTDPKLKVPGADSYYFMMLNANKRSVTANLKSERGREAVRALIAESDVVVENFAPGTIERLGFGWEDVRKINPRVVYAQIKGFGTGSPFSKYLAFDQIGQSTGGCVSTTGDRDDKPLLAGFHLGDAGTGVMCALGIVSALFQRQFTGRGQLVQVSMQEAVMSYGRSSFAAGALTREPARRHGNGGFAVAVPCNLYRCKGDGANDYCYIFCSRAAELHWNRLLKAIGREDLLGDPRYDTTDQRYEHRDEVDAMLLEWTMQRDKLTVMKILGEAGVPAGAVLDTEDLCNDSFLQESGAIVSIKHPLRGEFKMPGFPIRLSDSVVKVGPAPILGADTDDVYVSIAGLSESELAELRRESAI